MGLDRRNQAEVAAEDRRRWALAEKIVDTRAVHNGEHEVWDAVASGRLTALSPQLFYPTHTWNGLPAHDKSFLEAVAAGRNTSTTVLVGRSAARIGGMWVVALSPEKVELASCTGNVGPSLRSNPRYLVRRFRLPRRSTYRKHGIRATALIRSAIDIARLHGFHEGLVAFDWLLRAGADRDDIAAEIIRMGRFKGCATARRCLQHATELSESPYESLARAILIDAGFQPTPQFSVKNFRVDLSVGGGVLIEIDGDGKYADDTAGVIKRENDRKKRIENLGYRILRYRPAELLHEPARFITEVRRACEFAQTTSVT